MHCTPSFFFHSFIPDLPCSLKSSEASFIFFHHLLDLSHQPSSPCKAKAVTVTNPSPSRRRRQPIVVAVAAPCSLKLWSLFFFSSSQALISLRRRRHPNRRRCRRQPTPSEPTPQPVAVPAHACRRRRRQPTSGQCSLLFSSEFFNFFFGLIFLDLVLFCGEKWCCPYVILGKIKKTFVLE